MYYRKEVSVVKTSLGITNIRKEINSITDHCWYLSKQITKSADIQLLQSCLYELHDIVYKLAKGCGNPAVIEFEYVKEKAMMAEKVMKAEKRMYDTNWKVYASSPFAKMLSVNALPEIIASVERQAIEGNLIAAKLILDKVYPNPKYQSYANALNIKKIESQMDVDKAMNKIIESVTHSDDEQRMSLESASALVDIVIAKKNTMDECILVEVEKMKEQLGMIES